MYGAAQYYGNFEHADVDKEELLKGLLKAVRHKQRLPYGE